MIFKEVVEHEEIELDRLWAHADLLISEVLVMKMDSEKPEEFNGDYLVVAAVYGAAAVCECSEKKKMTKEEEVQSNEARDRRSGKEDEVGEANFPSGREEDEVGEANLPSAREEDGQSRRSR